jgi:hypothetical protein
MTRWSEQDLQRYQARTVGPNGDVSRNPVPITTHVRKYRNKPTIVDDIMFDSVAEAKRYNELKFFLSASEITNLELQPKFPLEVNGQLVCTYIADFSYWSHGCRVIEDVKSDATKTPQYRIKVKLLKALTGIIVREVA